MSWLRLDDRFTKHPKFEGWNVNQKWALLELFEYCAAYRTGGRIPDDLDLLPRSVTPKLIALAKASGWLEKDEKNGLRIHDWNDYNGTNPTILKTERQQRWRQKQADAPSTEPSTPPSTSPSTKPPTRAREPQPITTTQSVNGKTDDDESSLKQLLAELSRAGWDDALLDKAYDSPQLARAWLDYAQSRPDVDNVGGYARRGFLKGDPPPEPRRERVDGIDPAKVWRPAGETCECGRLIGDGHETGCPVLERDRERAADVDDGPLFEDRPAPPANPRELLAAALRAAASPDPSPLEA